MKREPPSYRIARATAADAAAFRAHWIRILSERLPVLFERDDMPTIDETMERLSRREHSPNSVVLVAREERASSRQGRVPGGARIVGVLDFRGYPVRQLAHSGLFGVSVEREHRGRGIGGALMGALFAWAPEHGITRIELEVFSNNPRAIAWYERLGFEHEGRRRGAVRIGDGFADVLLMAKRLPGPC